MYNILKLFSVSSVLLLMYSGFMFMMSCWFMMNDKMFFNWMDHF